VFETWDSRFQGDGGGQDCHDSIVRGGDGKSRADYKRRRLYERGRLLERGRLEERGG